MKKILLTLFFILGLIIAGCSEPENNETNEDSEPIDLTEEIPQTTEEIEEAVEQNLDVNNVSVKQENGTITIESEEGTAQITENEDGNLEAVVESEQGTTVTVEETDDGAFETTIDSEELGVPKIDPENIPPIEEWCIPGEEYSTETSEGSATGTIVGPTTFKDSEYCEAQALTQVSGLTLDATYYFTYGGEDIWLETEIAGQTIEQHITLN